jgi:hypothetical protein
MLKIIQTKILLAILAALGIIVGVATYQSYEARKAAILREQQQKRDEEFRKRVEQDKKQHSSAAGNEGKTWWSYVP